MAEREDRRLGGRIRRALAAEHRTHEAPPFERLWSRAASEAARARPVRGRGPRIRLGMAAAAIALLVAAATVALWLDARQSRRLDESIRLAAAVGEWRAPLDFLLQTPGREWLESTPSWDPRNAVAPRWPAVTDPPPAADSPQPHPAQEATP